MKMPPVEYLCARTPANPMLDAATALWVLYHVETEAFDRTLEHVTGPDGVRVMPWVRSHSTRYACERLRAMREEARKRMIDPEVMASANRSMNQWPVGGCEDRERWAKETLGRPDDEGLLRTLIRRAEELSSTPGVASFTAEVPAHLFDPIFGEGSTGYGKVHGQMVTPWGIVEVKRVGPGLPVKVTAVLRDPR